MKQTQEQVTSPEILAPQHSAEARGVAMSTTSPSSIQTAQASREWEKQLDLIKKTVAPGLTDDEFGLFCHVARVRNLDPLQRQIHAVKRKTWNSDKGAYEERMTLQVGIDGFRAIANRTGFYMPSPRDPVVSGKGTPELAVTFYVLKWSQLDKQYHEYSGIAHYREFVQTYKKDDKVKPNSMWEKMPYNQLEKCAEAKALRRGWPEELGQIYIDEEMQHLDSHQPNAPAQTVANDKTRARGDVSTLSQSKEQNRGHGQEAQVTGTSTSQAANSKKSSSKKSEAKAEAKSDEKKETKQKKSLKRGENYLLTCSVEKVTRKEFGEAEKKRTAQIIGCKGDKNVRFTVWNWHKSYFAKIDDALRDLDDVCIEVYEQQSATKTDETFTQLDAVLMVGDKKVKKLEDGTVIYENPEHEIAAAEASIDAPEIEGV